MREMSEIWGGRDGYGNTCKDMFLKISSMHSHADIQEIQ